MLNVVFAFVLAAAPGRGYAVQSPLPKASIGVFGDSIPAGVGGTAVSQQLDSLLPVGYVGINQAVSGFTAHQIATRVMAEAATACLGEPCGTYVVQGGVNTLKGGEYAAEVDDALVADRALNGDGGALLGIMDAVDWLHATYPRATLLAVGVLPYKGCDPVVCPPLVNVRPGERAALYNAAFLQACAARPWLRCVSPYDDFEDPAQPDWLRPDIMHADGIHLLSAGHLELAASIKALRRWP